MADKPPPPSTTLPPASEPFPGSRTPGWNDPPTLQYNPGQSTGRTRLNLNKRVAFPLQGTPAGNSNVVTTKPTAVVPPNQASFIGAPVLPPTNTTQPIAVVHPMPGNRPTVVAPPPTVPALALPSDACRFTAGVLREQVSAVQESTNVRRDEIERRLGIIEQLWLTNNLSIVVQEKLYRLAKAIADKAFNEAMDIYTTLVANHSNECVSWATALRHVVLTLQQQREVNEVVGEVSTGATTAVIVTTSSDSNNVIPAMYVPAMPRHVTTTTTLNEGTGAGARVIGASNEGSHATTVQHI